MKFIPNMILSPFEKVVLYCEGMKAGIFGFIFKTPVIIRDVFDGDATNGEVKYLGLSVNCKFITPDGTCVKDRSRHECFLMQTAIVGNREKK